MKIQPKELDEKLRKLLTKIELPLNLQLESTKYAFYGDRADSRTDCIQALQLRLEIIELIDSQPKGKYKQLDVEEEIKKTINENY